MSITLLFKVVGVKGNILLNITSNEKKICFENEFVFIATLSEKKIIVFITKTCPCKMHHFFFKSKN